MTRKEISFTRESRTLRAAYPFMGLMTREL